MHTLFMKYTKFYQKCDLNLRLKASATEAEGQKTSASAEDLRPSVDPCNTLINSSQINLSKFEIWYREGLQKLKKESADNSVNLKQKIKLRVVFSGWRSQGQSRNQ